MHRGKFGTWLGVCSAVLVAWSFSSGIASAQSVMGCTSCATSGPASTSFGSKCCNSNCPPAYHHCAEGPPRIKIHCGCPKPICNPCALPHFGYYQTCWSPWPFPPDWSHCPVPPPAASVTLEPHPSNVFGSPIAPQPHSGSVPGTPILNGTENDVTLPSPRSVGSGR